MEFEKKCPHCGQVFNFWNFLLWCGSDSLVAHSSSLKFHRSEHRCPHCHKLFWIERNPEKVQQALEKSAPFFFLAAFLYMFLTEVFFKLSLTQAIGMAVILLFFGYPISWTFIKCMSSDLKPDGVEYERV